MMRRKRAAALEFLLLLWLALPLASGQTSAGALAGARQRPALVSAQVLDLSGDWDTNHGVFYVQQQGRRVFGEYDYQGRRDNRFEGQWEGNVLVLRWRQPSFPPPQQEGRARLQLLAQGTRWRGQAFDATGTPLAEWRGFKIGATPEAPDHEFAPIHKANLRIEDFTATTLDGRQIRLSEFVRHKPLVLLSYIIPWCKNCNFEQPFLKQIYAQYRARGFDILLVSNYGHPSDVMKFVQTHRPPFPLVVATTSTDDATRTSTPHYRYRAACGDKRKWGTPFNIFIVGGSLTDVYAAAGELIPEDAARFLRSKLERP